MRSRHRSWYCWPPLLVDLPPAAREHEHRLPLAHQGPDVVTRAADHPARGQEVAPQRYRVVRVLAESPNGKAAALPDLGHHERQVEEAVDRVVADDQRAVGGHVLEAVELRLRDAAERLEQRDEAVDRPWRRQLGNLDRIVSHRRAAGGLRPSRACRSAG
jgi:hypothetical protein